MKQAQAWSVDAIVGVFMFIIIIVSVIAFTVSRGQSARLRELKEDGERIFSSLSGEGDHHLIVDRKVEPAELSEIKNISYSALKSELGVASDFCIYFVDGDGNLVYLDEAGEVVGIGSPRALINGAPCNST